MRQQGLHIRRFWYHNVCQGEPLWMYHHCGWKEAKLDIYREGKNLPVIWGGLHKDRVKSMAPESTRMCGSGDSSHTTSGFLSPSGKVASL